MKYQVTFFDKENKYKPVACIIEAENRVEIAKGKWKDAMKKVCIKRGWKPSEMVKMGYTTWKCRGLNKPQLINQKEMAINGM